jgi:hypothetical protein
MALQDTQASQDRKERWELPSERRKEIKVTKE